MDNLFLNVNIFLHDSQWSALKYYFLHYKIYFLFIITMGAFKKNVASFNIWLSSDMFDWIIVAGIYQYACDLFEFIEAKLNFWLSLSHCF